MDTHHRDNLHKLERVSDRKEWRRELLKMYLDSPKTEEVRGTKQFNEYSETELSTMKAKIQSLAKAEDRRRLVIALVALIAICVAFYFMIPYFMEGVNETW